MHAQCGALKRPQASINDAMGCQDHGVKRQAVKARSPRAPGGRTVATARRERIHLPAVVRAGLRQTEQEPDTWPSFEEQMEEFEAASADYDTIAAIVTGAQQGAVSIIRLSGMDAVSIASKVFRPAGGGACSSSSSSAPTGGPRQRRIAKAGQQQQQQKRKPWAPESHRIYYGHAVDGQGQTIDEVLLLPMLEPRSYTAEDVVELHTHGGGLCARRVLERCLEAGARLAQPGEFTLRAFLNGRLDLSQAESVSQLIAARTVAAADSALAGLAGGLGREVGAMRAECIDLLVELDARLDFDEDLPPLDVPGLVSRVKSVSARVAAALNTARQGQLLSSGLQVALVGRPNVGKSSLLNALSGTERAIVTEVAGTTRDIVEAGIVVGGIPVVLLDTAGLREASDRVERIGVERSMAAARGADIVVMVLDAQAGWTPEDAEIFGSIWHRGGSSSSSDESSGDGGEEEAPGASGRPGPPSLLVLNKSDLRGQAAADSSGNGAAAAAAGSTELPQHVRAAFSAVVETSAATGAGLGELRHEMLQLAGAPELAPGGVGWAVNARQAEALLRAREALGRVEESVAGGLPLDFWTIDLRAAALALGEVSGDEVTEDVLDAIFSRFCIGK